jgi:hypothetical protein
LGGLDDGVVALHRAPQSAATTRRNFFQVMAHRERQAKPHSAKAPPLHRSSHAMRFIASSLKRTLSCLEEKQLQTKKPERSI